MSSLSEDDRFEIIISIIGIIAAVITIAGGVYILFDDLKDIGKMDRVHHWHWGLILIFMGLLIAIINFYRIILILYPERREEVIKWLREKFWMRS